MSRDVLRSKSARRTSGQCSQGEGGTPPGHLWRWELEPLDTGHTLVTHTYDWTRLTDPKRLERARITTADNLRASMDRLAVIADGA